MACLLQTIYNIQITLYTCLNCQRTERLGSTDFVMTYTFTIWGGWCVTAER